MATVIPFLEKVADETPTIGGFTASYNREEEILSH